MSPRAACSGFRVNRASEGGRYTETIRAHACAVLFLGTQPGVAVLLGRRCRSSSSDPLKSPVLGQPSIIVGPEGPPLNKSEAEFVGLSSASSPGYARGNGQAGVPVLLSLCSLGMTVLIRLRPRRGVATGGQGLQHSQARSLCYQNEGGATSIRGDWGRCRGGRGRARRGAFRAGRGFWPSDNPRTWARPACSRRRGPAGRLPPVISAAP